MITSLDLKFRIPDDMLGIVVEKRNPAPKEGESLQLYIPILMPNIQKTIPTKQINTVNFGLKLFLNDARCRPRSSVILKSQNYLTGYLEKNSVWKNDTAYNIKERPLTNDDNYEITTKSKAVTKTDTDTNTKVTASPAGVNVSVDTDVDVNVDVEVDVRLYEKYKEYYTTGGEKVECYPPNGKLSKLVFNNNKYLN